MVTQRASKILAEHASSAGDGLCETIGPDDQVLTERARKGDMRAFGLLVSKYQDRLFNMVYRMCPQAEDAEEITQEAFLKSLENISRFRGQSQYYTWLFRIAANLVISHRRRQVRLSFESIDAPDGTQAKGLAQKNLAGPDASASSAETMRRIEQAMEQLDEESRLLVVLRDIEDMSYAQIARIIDSPVGTVKSRLHRARCELRERLKGIL